MPQTELQRESRKRNWTLYRLRGTRSQLRGFATAFNLPTKWLGIAHVPPRSRRLIQKHLSFAVSHVDTAIKEYKRQWKGEL